MRLCVIGLTAKLRREEYPDGNIIAVVADVPVVRHVDPLRVAGTDGFKDTQAFILILQFISCSSLVDLRPIFVVRGLTYDIAMLRAEN